MTSTPDGTRRPVSLLIDRDPTLASYARTVLERSRKIRRTERRLTRDWHTLYGFASGHHHFGLHREADAWVFREWAPNATAVFLLGEMTGWEERPAFALEKVDPPGQWAIRLRPDTLNHGDLYRLRIHWAGGSGDRIPAWTRRVVQDPETLIFNAQVWAPPTPYVWQCTDFKRPSDPPLIYEAHVGMAQEAPAIGSYRQFTEHILPRITEAGYNTIQLMAIQEHPYYASFGYQVSSFFAASSRFGPPEDFKRLVDAAHARGLAVVMDLVHSHAASNEVEGLSRFDGTVCQYFHEGPRGRHPAWDSRCFDYGKDAVLHFLLSNCRFWLEEYRLDGFRFDGVTSMLYRHHGLGKAFTSYADYFDETVDEDALAYLALANRLIHHIRPDGMTVAEDVSGMPGLAMPLENGGYGFDYRLAMGVPDHWIRLTKEVRDEDWSMGHLWFELTNRRQDEKTIGYAESHDQALVGDQTLMFRLGGSDMFDKMHTGSRSFRVDRAMSLHKMIRLITLATAGNGYLNFMGNEFGHPEWIDFPREGNQWSFHHARRQWHLMDDPALKYSALAAFDRRMIRLAQGYGLLKFPELCLMHEHNDDKVIAFSRAGLVFAFNFHPTRSHADYPVVAPSGTFRLILDSDHPRFGGHGRLTPDQTYETVPVRAESPLDHRLHLYLPTRTALVLEPVRPAASEDR